MSEQPLIACEVAVPPGGGVRTNDAQCADALAFARSLTDLQDMPAWGAVQAEIVRGRLTAMGQNQKARTAEELADAQAAYRATFALDGLLAQATQMAGAAAADVQARVERRIAAKAVSDEDVPGLRHKETEFTAESAMAAAGAAGQVADMVQTPAWKAVSARLAQTMCAHAQMAQTCAWTELAYHREVVRKLGRIFTVVQDAIDRGTDAAMWLRTEAEARGKE